MSDRFMILYLPGVSILFIMFLLWQIPWRTSLKLFDLHFFITLFSIFAKSLETATFFSVLFLLVLLLSASKKTKALIFGLYFTFYAIVFHGFYYAGITPVSKEDQISMTNQTLRAIKDAIIRYNAKNPATPCTNIHDLVPRYIAELHPDTWGNNYMLDTESGILFSAGPDGKYDEKPDSEVTKDNIVIHIDSPEKTSENKQ